MDVGTFHRVSAVAVLAAIPHTAFAGVLSSPTAPPTPYGVELPVADTADGFRLDTTFAINASGTGGSQPASQNGLMLAMTSGAGDGAGSGSGSGSGSDSGFTLEPPQNSNLGSFDISINAGSGLAGNTAALDAFNRAAAMWESWISDPITVNIDADLSNLGNPSVIGHASSVILSTSYNSVRNAVVSDAADEPEDAIVASLPTSAQFNALLPAGFGLDGDLSANKANLKAIGFTGLDASFGATDATITFNTQFTFDFDNSDGVTPGTMDFESVAAHEIGHALGFTSVVDDIDELLDDSQTDDVSPRVLDLFRFDNDGGSDPSNAAEFTSFTRSLVPDNDEVFDDITNEWRLSTGALTGDGRQASHWKDNALAGDLLGILDPTLATGQILSISSADLRALDLIGYDLTSSPEPGPLAVMSAGLIFSASYRPARP